MQPSSLTNPIKVTLTRLQYHEEKRESNSQVGAAPNLVDLSRPVRQVLKTRSSSPFT